MRYPFHACVRGCEQRAPRLCKSSHRSRKLDSRGTMFEVYNTAKKQKDKMANAGSVSADAGDYVVT